MKNRLFLYGSFVVLFSCQLSWAQPSSSSESLLYKPRPKGEIVSEAVAQAGPHVVTSREVVISAILDEALAAPLKTGSGLDRKAWIIEVKSEAYIKQLAQILMELVVQMEAENFAIGQVNQAEIANFEKHILEQVKNWKEWQQLEVSSTEIQQILMRKVRAKNFLKFKMESSGVSISDEEAKAHYEQNKAKYGNQSFALVKESIKESLAQNQLQEKLKDWFDILKRKYRVRYLGASS